MAFKFNIHWNLRDKHAVYGASKPAWLNYDRDKMKEYYKKSDAKERGTRLHAWAAETISLGLKQPKSNNTISMYINDGISYRMTPELVLYHSDTSFGTADTISFENGYLRIHDLKTGTGPVHHEQLEIYAAWFCLEYHIRPSDIKIELRIYQNNKKDIWFPEPERIEEIISKIYESDEIVKELKE